MVPGERVEGVGPVGLSVQGADRFEYAKGSPAV